MNKYHVAGAMVATGFGVLGGVLLSFGEAERRAQKRYNESFESLKRALERAHNPQTINVYAPAETEEDLGDLTEMEKNRRQWDEEDDSDIVINPDVPAPVGINKLTPKDNGEAPPEYVNHYKKALEAKDTPVEMFVDGGINDYGCSYIEEDEFEEEDGRYKGQITIVMNDGEPSFFLDGMQINDWAERVGDSILVDFYQFVPPDAPPILYVRNHKRDEDYEVTREIA